MKLIGRWARRFGLARAVCVVLVFALVPLRMLDPRPIEELRLRTFDLFQVLRPREQTARPVVIVDIDEASLKEIGQWPWPRTVVADLVTRLTALGAAAIGFDAVFPEPDRLSPNLLASTLHDLDDATRERLRNLPSNDAILADAIRKSRVVLGESVSDKASAGPAVEASGYGVITTKGAPDARTFLVYYPTLVRNLPVLEQAAAGRGIFTQVEEHDGIVRRAPVIMHAGNAFVPSLSLEMLRVGTNSNSPLIRSNQNGIQSVNASRFRLPTDEHGRLWIHFNHVDPRRYVSARDVLQGNVAADRIRGKLVLVGTSAIGLSDNKTTPLDPVMPGVEVHAQIIESILTNALLSAPSWAIGAEIIAAVVFGLAIIIAAPMLPAAILIALGAILILGLIGLSWYFFAAHNLLIDFTYPLISSWLIYLVLTFVNYFREQKQRQQIRSAFGFYLSPPLVEQLAKSPDRLVLGGEERRMTILFSDVRGFTTISEHYKDDPQGLTQLMNRFLTPLTNAIIDRKGHDRQVYRRRHHGVLERSARRRRP